MPEWHTCACKWAHGDGSPVGDPDVECLFHREIRRQRNEAIEALWECMKAAGADTSYADDPWHAHALGQAGSPTLAIAALQAVEELRRDYIEAGGG